MDLSIIIPSKQEPNLVAACTTIANLAKPKTYRVEIILVLGPLDDTPCLPPLNLPISVLRTDKYGRGHQLHVGASQSSGELLLFIHADSRLPATALDLIAASSIEVAAFNLQFDSSHWWFRVLEVATKWRIKMTRVPYGDQGVLITRPNYDLMGGYKDITSLEDVVFMETCKRMGIRLHMFDESMTTSIRHYVIYGYLKGTLRYRLIVFRHWIKQLLQFFGY